MKTILLATGALLAASTAPALAQDAPAAAPEQPATMSTDMPTFTGPRVEFFGGWDRAGVRARYDDGTTVTTDKGHKDGATAGALLGFDVPIGDRFVGGVFGSYSLSTARDCSTAATGYYSCLKAGREIEGGARLGAKLGTRSLVYVKGAYVNGQLNSDINDGTTFYTGRADRDGWRAGAGVEYALNKHLYLNAEYDYTRFRSFDADRIGLADTNLRFDRNQVLGGFGIRF